MGKADFSPEHKEILDSFLLGFPGVVPGKMFGYPAYYVNDKLFACVYGDGVGIKVTEKMANELVGKKGIIPFVPLGRRRMKEWVQINREGSKEYLKDQEIFESSVKYVSSLRDKKE